MKISKRSEYGIRALVNLASDSDSSAIKQIRTIAHEEQIPLKFLEQILVTLKNAGIVQSKLGAGGGYHLGKPPEAITLGQIIRILDGPLAPIRCVSQTAYEKCACPDEKTCGLRMVMLDVRNEIAAILDTTNLADVTRKVEGVKDDFV